MLLFDCLSLIQFQFLDSEKYSTISNVEEVIQIRVYL